MASGYLTKPQMWSGVRSGRAAMPGLPIGNAIEGSMRVLEAPSLLPRTRGFVKLFGFLGPDPGRPARFDLESGAGAVRDLAPSSVSRATAAT
jgi:hypothetical protein